MSSRFWGEASDSSDSEHSSSSDGEEKVATQAAKKPEKSWGDYDDGSSSEDERRLVRSEKDKRWDALRDCLKKITQHKRSQDYVELFEDVGTLEKLIARAQNVIDAEGPPNFLIRALVDLIAYVEEKHKDKAGLKKCSKGKAQAINKLQRKLPKSTEQFKMAIDDCTSNPNNYASEDDAGSGSEDQSSSSSSSSEDSDSSSSSSSSSDSSDSSDDEDESSDEEDQGRGGKTAAPKKKAAPKKVTVKKAADDSDSESDDSDDDSDDSDVEDKKKVAPKGAAKAKAKAADSKKAPATKKKAASDSDDDSSSSDSDSDDSDSSSADSDDESGSSSSSSSDSDSSSDESDASSVASAASRDSEADFETRHARAMIRWGYKTPAADEKDKKDTQRAAAAKRRTEAERRKALKEKQRQDEEEAGNVGAVEARRSSVLLPDGEAMDEDAMAAKVREVTADRNKRGAERLEQVEILRRLSQLASKKELPHIQAEILGFLATFGLDAIQASGIPPTVAAWQQVFDDLWQLMLLLAKHEGMKVKLGTSTTADGDVQASDTDVLVSTAAMLMSFLERLDDHLMRSLQACDAHVKEYQERMHHDLEMITLLWVAWSWFNRQKEKGLPEVWRTSLRLVEHMYYIPDRIAVNHWAMVGKRLEEALGPDTCGLYAKVPTVPSEMVAELCREVFAVAPAHEHRALFRAQVALVYSLALHDHFYQARDLFNGGNLYDVAMSQDVNEQILYNRGLTQIGLAAFRKGLITAAANALSDICGANKQRELLAQGVAVVKGFEKTVEQEKAERRRLLPTHMHINLDLVESAYNICSMLLEVPSLCGPDASLETRQRQSRFKRALDLFEKSNVLPESSREIIMTAAKALQRGLWQKCQDHIFSLRCWNYIHPETARESVQALISQKIKETGLRSYILSYAHLYDAISVDRVSEMFNLHKSVVYSLVSKMMINREVSAFWDAGSETILVTKTTPTRLQLAALSVADGVASAVEQAESMFAAPPTSQQNRRAQKSR